MNMALSERTSIAQFRRCTKCKLVKELSGFYPSKRNKGGLRPDCKMCGAETQRKYRRKYGYAANKRYDHSAKGRARTRRWYHSPKNKEWWLAHPTYQVDRYHRIQEMASCYQKINIFYPGYRFIKALENAKVVEIK